MPKLEMLSTNGYEEKALVALGAIPVWDAVINRGRYLARRRLQGVIYGYLGDPVDGYRWMIDGTEGRGTLAIRMAMNDHLALTEGQRLVSWGAWEVDAQKRWYWKSDRLMGLAPGAAPSQQGTASAPSMQIASIPAAAEDAQPVSQRITPGDILFQIHAVPASPSDGWEIADRTEDPPVALLLLPGEQAAYGGQDYRTPDEHWHLEPRVTYTVQVRRFWPAPAGELIRMRAIAAPRRIESESGGGLSAPR